MSSYILWGLIFFALILAINILKRKPASQSSDQQGDYEYELCPALMTKAELKFYTHLADAVADEYQVFAKVRIADVLKPKSKLYDRKTWWKAFNAVSCKHFDYVLCDKNTLTIKFVIELDDSTHEKPSRIKRDAFVNKACESALLNLVRFKVATTYDKEETRKALGLISKIDSAA